MSGDRAYHVRDPKNKNLNPPTAWFQDQLKQRTAPGSTLLWNTYSFKEIPIIPRQAVPPFGLPDEKIIWRFLRYYKHLANITGYFIEPYCFVSWWFNSLHTHNIEIWKPKEPKAFQHDFILPRIDTAFRKAFPSPAYPNHSLTKARSSSKTKPDFVIHSQHTTHSGGAPFYARDGHNYVPDLHRTFYPKR